MSLQMMKAFPVHYERLHIQVKSLGESMSGDEQLIKFRERFTLR